jgi:hypothetical protein
MKTEDLTQRMAQQIVQWQVSQQNQTSGYEYEKSFTDLWQELGQEVFQASLGEAKYNKNSKKSQNAMGEVIVAKTHPLAQCPNGLRLSSHLQEVITYLGSDFVFEEASGLLEKLLGVNVSAKQIQKVSEDFGQLLEEEAQQLEASITSSLKTSQEVYTYVQYGCFFKL